MSLVDGDKCPYILKQLNYTGDTGIKINLSSDLDIPVSEHDIINGFYVDEQSHTMNNQDFINILLNEGAKQGVDFSPYNTAKMEEKKKIESELNALLQVFGDGGTFFSGLAPSGDPRTTEWLSLSEEEGIIEFLQKRDISVNDENIETVQRFRNPS